MPTHYLNQYWSVVNGTSGMKFIEIWMKIQRILCIKNQFENDVCTTAIILYRIICVNTLAPGRPGCNFKTAIFNLVLLIGILTSSKDNALRWMPRDLTDDKSTLVQVMAWCRKAKSHYLSQCWPSSMSPYGITRPQLVNSACNHLCFRAEILLCHMLIWNHSYYHTIGALLHL